MSDIFQNLLSQIVRDSSEPGFVSYWPWDVIPIFMIPFVLVGIILALKRKLFYLTLPILIGAMFWIFYCFYPYVIIIEQPRVVAITAVLLVMLGGFGIEKAIQYFLTRWGYLNDVYVSVSIKLITLLFFIVLAIFYSKFSLWHKLVLKLEEGGRVQTFLPSPPVTRYLSEYDLVLFRDIKGKRFISPPWKGLVIAVATHNYPLESKGATLTSGVLNYRRFMSSSCGEKHRLAQKYKISYVYSTAFSCDRFKEIGKSRENLFLYQFIN